tara:strand:- start:294760 stop:295407 length:648 start_codon:yes stop_codon:yes gene_type:complete
MPGDFQDYDGLDCTYSDFPVKAGMPRSPSNFQPLLGGLARLGRDKLIISRFEHPGEVEIAADECGYIECPPDVETFHAACDFFLCDAPPFKGEFIPGEYFAFDLHEDWVVKTEYECGCLLAGSPEVIEACYLAAGGEDIVRARYYHYEICDSTHFDEENLVPCEYQAKRYDMVGWPYPVYPNYRLYYDAKIDWSAMFDDTITSIGPDGLKECPWD